MSFSANTKNEICRIHLNKRCCAVAEAYGVLLYCNTFSGREVKIITESRSFAARLPKLFKKAFGLEFDELPEDPERPGKLNLGITDREKIRRIFNAYGYTPDTSVSLHVNLGVLEEECDRVAFIRGAFLAGGSVTDPEKRYHLELVTTHHTVSREVHALLLEVGYAPKATSRSGSSVLYFKQSDAIEDFLTLAGAPVCAMGIMEAKVEKDLRNSINRRVNCETANLTKVVDAAQEQIEAIRIIIKRGELEALPEKLRATAQLRVENPEATLTELSEMLDPPITKSAINHRMRKLIELSKA